MSVARAPQLTQFALDVAAGLGASGQKWLAPRYFYDSLGSVLFDAITLLPEYGLTRADERILLHAAPAIAAAAGEVALVAELGSGSGKKTRRVLEAFNNRALMYAPIDVSAGALDACRRELQDAADVRPICRDWIPGLDEALALRNDERPVLLLFLGSSIGNLDRSDIRVFLAEVRQRLHTGDFFLLGADLVKQTDRMLAAYDDATGVTAAFNKNVLGRINRELGGDFDLRCFRHEARWNQDQRRIEMHLVADIPQPVFVSALNQSFTFAAGESIWTESSHKFTESELEEFAGKAGFATVDAWNDREWPFVNVLWRAA